MEEKSKKYKLNREDGLKIARGGGIALGGALIVYLLGVIPQIDFAAYTPLVVAIAGILLNSARKYLKDNS